MLLGSSPATQNLLSFRTRGIGTSWLNWSLTILKSFQSTWQISKFSIENPLSLISETATFSSTSNWKVGVRKVEMIVLKRNCSSLGLSTEIPCQSDFKKVLLRLADSRPAASLLMLRNLKPASSSLVSSPLYLRSSHIYVIQFSLSSTFSSLIMPLRALQTAKMRIDKDSTIYHVPDGTQAHLPIHRIFSCC